MGKFIDSNLMKDENLIFETKYHWSILLGGVVFFALGLVILIVSLVLDLAEFRTSFVFGSLAIMAVGGLKIVFDFLVRKTSEFAITSRRMIMKTGIVSTKSLELLHRKIETIGIDQGLIGKIFGFGSVTLTGTGGKSHSFRFIELPFEFRTHAQEEIEKAQK